MWHKSESAEVAAYQLLHVLFSVPQISVKLDSIPPSHKQMLSFWLGFMKTHLNTLQKGQFLPHSPLYNYPMIEAIGEGEKIVGLYASGMTVKNETGIRKLYVANASGENTVMLDLGTNYKGGLLKTFDCQGKLVKEINLPANTSLKKVIVPVSGLMELVSK